LCYYSYLCVYCIQSINQFVPLLNPNHQDRRKNIFDKHYKLEDFKVNDLVLKWDARNEDKGKHVKFHHLFIRPFKIVMYHRNNAYVLQEINGELTAGGLVNGRFRKVGSIEN
jgi:hypothetical protein